MKNNHGFGQQRFSSAPGWWAKILVVMIGLSGFPTGEISAESKEGKMKEATTGELKAWRSKPELKGLEAAFQFLESTKLADLQLGKHPIVGEDVFALITKASSRSPESGQFETHEKYIDIHTLISGQETIGFMPGKTLTIEKAYDAEKDIAFYLVPKQYKRLEMRPGKYAVFLTGEGHLPMCHLQGPHELHKVVIKVRESYRAAKAK